MKRTIKLNEDKFHNFIKTIVGSLIKEEYGKYPNGQLDLFFKQDEVDTYRKQLNRKWKSVIRKCEEACLWAHKDIEETPNQIIITSYPFSKTSASKKEFIESIMRYAPKKDMVSFKAENYTLHGVPRTQIVKIIIDKA